MFGYKARLIRSINDQLEASRAECHRSDVSRERYMERFEQLRTLLGTPANCSLDIEAESMKSEISRLQEMSKPLLGIADPLKRVVKRRRIVKKKKH